MITKIFKKLFSTVGMAFLAMMFAVVGGVFAATNWSTWVADMSVNDGDIMTAEKWNAMVQAVGELQTASSETSLYHANNCAATESFVVMDGTTSKGFCIDNTEQGALSYPVATKTCMTAGKRLPTHTEWQLACLSGAGSLTGMTNNFEWTQNEIMLNDSNYYDAVSGNGSCYTSSSGLVAHTGGSYGTNYLHCVH